MTEATGATARFALDGELDLEASLRLLPLGPPSEDSWQR